MPAGGRKLRDIAPPAHQPLPGFRERFPGVWLPEGFKPNPYEDPTPIANTAEEAGVLYLKCAQSLPFFIFKFCWALHTDDPSGAPVYHKFPTYPYLQEFFADVQQPENLHIEKSRQLLMSWAWMGVFLWDILFHDAWANLAISYKQRLVDDGAWSSTEKSLFGKLRIIWQSLPPYLQHPLQIRHLRILCPMTGSYVAGDTAGSGGRGGVFKRALVDEAAHVASGEMMFRALGQACKHGMVLNSTPLGKGNLFARIRFQANTTFRHKSLHWTLHPDKAVGVYCECGWHSDASLAATVSWRQQYEAHVCIRSSDPSDPFRRHPRSPWYDAATSDYTQEQIASEFDLSYEKSQRGRVYESFDPTRHAREHTRLKSRKTGDELGVFDEQRESMVAYRRRYLEAVLDPKLPTVCGWDFGVGDPTSLVLGQVVDVETMRIRWVDAYEKNNASWEHFKKFVHGLWGPVVKQVTGLQILHYGDPSGKNRNASLESWISNLNLATRESAFPIVIVASPNFGEVLEWLDFIHELIRKGNFEVMLWCAHLIDALGQYHFPLDSDGNPVPGEHLPVHDQWCHVMDAMRYVYKYHFPHRLKDVHAEAVSAGSILGLGDNDSREKVPSEW